MNTKPMSDSHQTGAPWAWQLGPNEAATLAAEPIPRWLKVETGCVWLTRANGAAQADDIWLAAGESVALPPGSEWVLEAWPQARLTLLLKPQAVIARAAWWRLKSSSLLTHASSPMRRASSRPEA